MIDVFRADDCVISRIVSAPTVVKIDVEGAEPLVLGGMRKTLLRNRTVRILFEFWRRGVFLSIRLTYATIL